MKGNLEKLALWAAVITVPVSLFTVRYAYVEAEAARQDFEEASQTRDLDWTPVLNIFTIRSTAEDHGELGVFLQNAGKGPAKITAVCQEHPYSELSIPGLRQTRSVLQAGDILKTDETVPLIEFRPSAEQGWEEGQITLVHQGLRQVEERGASITICYESMYRGCFVTRRGPHSGKVWQQTREQGCDDPCCGKD